jgi:dUTP pyrophosphatase
MKRVHVVELRKRERPLVVKFTTRVGATIPTLATDGSSGYDLHCIVEDKLSVGGRVLSPRATITIDTGVCVEIPKGYEGQVRSRSGLAAAGIVVANSPGTIDSDYRGEIKVILHNTTDITRRFFGGERIAQLVFTKVYHPKMRLVNMLGYTNRGAGGLGSTGAGGLGSTGTK